MEMMEFTVLYYCFPAHGFSICEGHCPFPSSLGGGDCIEPILLFFCYWPLEQSQSVDLKKALAFWGMMQAPCSFAIQYPSLYLLIVELDGPIGVVVFGGVTEYQLGVGQPKEFLTKPLV